MRPNTLNVSRDKTDNDTNKFIREALHAWRAKARCSVVPAERLRDLFEELHFSPTEKQINEMLQTAKLFARRGSSLEPNVSGNSKRVNGLTFGEFCVLAADLKRFRTSPQQPQPQHQKPPSTPPPPPAPSSNDVAASSSASAGGHNQTNRTIPEEAVTTDGRQTFYNGAAAPGTPGAPEVFLGGSCNPTTWRADVAIPALDRLGISFYNPQVSDWTPDLIELEHRAKEKARVLFFVMDSETRASAGTIEAAHIAGQNARHLVLVLHPYQPEQCILNEPLCAQEFLDLKRNQQLLRELVTRRGLPVLDNIPSGLQLIREILAGTSERPTPHNIAARLMSVSRAFDLVANPAHAGRITIAQCQGALPVLGYAPNLLSTDNLYHILRSHRDAVAALEVAAGTAVPPTSSSANNNAHTTPKSADTTVLTFDEFCMLTSYLTVLQQEIHESGCVSPIKGTNLQPPPIYLTNQLDFTQAHTAHTAVTSAALSAAQQRTSLAGLYGTQIFRTSSCKSVPEGHQPSSGSAELYRGGGGGNVATRAPKLSRVSQIVVEAQQLDGQHQHQQQHSSDANDSDSNDSVFSGGSDGGSSTDSVVVRLRPKPAFEMRDVYLGGSCALRTKWRTELAVPVLEQRGCTYHLPVLHESICGSQLGADGQELVTAAAATPERCMFNATLMDACRVLLFVITNETRSLAPMTLAAHYIGLGYNVVLCVQMLPEFCIIGSEKLTPAAIKDYNRGRSYLTDLAKRQGVPVFGELRTALDCVVEKVRTYNSRNSI